MRIVIFSHPRFFPSFSMARFANCLSHGMKQRGHEIEIWSPKPRFFSIPLPYKIKKWFGYIDQFILFPLEVRIRLKKCFSDTLFIFTDHALGPWVPLVSNRPHVIHCHDFLAQYSARNELTEQKTNWTGKQYQSFIHKGFSKGKHFVSVSNNTRSQLQKLLKEIPITSEVIYNQVLPVFQIQNIKTAREHFSFFLTLNRVELISKTKGYLLHVGGNVWYKNKRGVLEIYEALNRIIKDAPPLIMIGDKPGNLLLNQIKNSGLQHKIVFLTNVSDEQLANAYTGASLLLFPSLEEGFGWPIAEAMACGCPVVTTDKAPMTEIGGDAAFYIPRRPEKKEDILSWASNAALKVNDILTMTLNQRQAVIEAGLNNVQQFNSELIFDQTERLYKKVLRIYGVMHEFVNETSIS